MVRSQRKRQFGYESLESRNLLTAQMLLDFTTTQVGLNPPGALNPTDFIEFEGEIFFSTSRNEARPLQLWKTDGTSSGTDMITKLPGRYVPFFQVVNDQLLAVVGDGDPNGAHGYGEFHLYRYDDGDFSLVETLIAGEPYVPRVLDNFTAAPNGRTYFSTYNAGPGGWSIWSTDGTDARREYFGNFEPGPELTIVGSTLFTTEAKPEANSTSFQSIELYKFDLDSSTMSLVRDIEPGKRGSYPRQLTDVMGSLYFTANTSGEGRELWVSDGTRDGTQLVALSEGPRSSNPTNLVAYDGGLYFTASSDSGLGVWQVSSVGAVPQELSPSDTQPELSKIDDALFFTTRTGNETTLWTIANSEAEQLTTFTDARVSLQSIGNQQFVIARFESETQVFQANHDEAPDLIGEFGPEIGQPELLLVTDQGFLFEANGSLLRTTESDPFAELVGVFPSRPSELIAYSDMLVYAARGNHGSVLWATDGASFDIIRDVDFRTRSSTVRLVDGGHGPLIMIEKGPDQHRFPDFDYYFYSATLFTSDGSPENTIELKRDISIREVVDFAGRRNFHAANGSVYFFAGGNPGHLGELWKSDLTRGGTVPVTDPEEHSAARELLHKEDDSSIVRFGGSWLPSFSTAEGDYFISRTKIMRREMTETDTSFVEVVDFESLGITPTSTTTSRSLLDLLEPPIIVNEDIVYFSATHPETGVELWQSDGTLEGTQIVADIVPGPRDSNPKLLPPSNGVVYFTADDGVHGRELWAVSNGSHEPNDLADLDSDGVVNQEDFLVLADNFGTSTNRRENGDIDGNGRVDFADFLLFAFEFKERPV